MGYDRGDSFPFDQNGISFGSNSISIDGSETVFGDSFPFDFEPDGISFGSNSKGNLSPRSYPIQFERK